MSICLRRREFVAGLGGAAAWPLAASAQQRAMPVIGYLSGTVPRPRGGRQDLAFHQGLKEMGFVEGQNVSIEYRSAEDHYERLPTLAADLVRRRVAVIVATGGARGPLAAKQATTTIPIVFFFGSDPVELGLVDSLSRPGGNITGVTNLGRELLAKRLEVLRELLPHVNAIGLIVNPNNPNTEPSVKEAQALAQTGRWRLHIVEVRSGADIEASVARLVQMGAGAFLMATDNVINSRTDQLISLAARYRLPAIYQGREAAEAGGLMTYGGDGAEQTRIAGVYVGRILKGAKPADLPVQQVTKVELVINLKTAKALGITVPITLRGRADEVIE
jgi:putative ABC transport system substrate-binding protein